MVVKHLFLPLRNESNKTDPVSCCGSHTRVTGSPWAREEKHLGTARVGVPFACCTQVCGSRVQENEERGAVCESSPSHPGKVGCDVMDSRGTHPSESLRRHWRFLAIS